MKLFVPDLVQVAQESQPHFEHQVLVELHDGFTFLEVGFPSLKVESSYHFPLQSPCVRPIGPFKLREVPIKPSEEYFGPDPSLDTIGDPAFLAQKDVGISCSSCKALHHRLANQRSLNSCREPFQSFELSMAVLLLSDPVVNVCLVVYDLMISELLPEDVGWP